MRIVLHWDSQAEDHIQRHGLSVDDVEDAISDRRAFVLRAKGRRYIVYGQTAGGRYIKVAVEKLKDGFYPVTAYDMDSSDRRLFERHNR